MIPTRGGKILNGGVEEAVFTWKRHKLTRKWEGVVKIAYDMVKDEKDMESFMTEKVCDSCGGHRLKAPSLAVKVADSGIANILDMPIEDSHRFFQDEKNFEYFNAQEAMISAPILKEIRERIYFLYDVGLGYITLGRDARTISGGEAQRIRVASQIGSGLTGVMYVLDEPSIGLHERDTAKTYQDPESAAGKRKYRNRCRTRQRDNGSCRFYSGYRAKCR